MSDLERDLRAMLGERAADIRSVPDGLLTLDRADDGEDEVIDLGLHRRDVLAAARRRWPLLIAAAVVLAVLAGVLTAVSGNTAPPRTPPANHSSAPAERVPTVYRATCPIADPGQWNSTVRQASFTVIGTVAGSATDVTGVTSNGDAVVEYDNGDDHTDTFGTDLGLLPSGSNMLRPLGYFGTRLTRTVGFELDVDVDNASRTAVVSLNASHSNAGESVSAIYAVNLDTGHRAQLLAASNYPKYTRISQGYIQDSTVYWEVDSLRNYDGSRVYAVPASGGVPRVVAPNNAVELEKTALGIDWSENGTVDRAARVPAVVARSAAPDVNVPDAFHSYVTDGTAYAWSTQRGALDYYDSRAGRVVSFRGLLGEPGTTQSFVNAVAGPLVFFQSKSGDHQFILDTRTGALVRVTSGGSMVGAPDGTAIGNLLLDGPAAAPGRLMRLDTSSLAPLRC